MEEESVQRVSIYLDWILISCHSMLNVSQKVRKQAIAPRNSKDSHSLMMPSTSGSGQIRSLTRSMNLQYDLF